MFINVSRTLYCKAAWSLCLMVGSICRSLVSFRHWRFRKPVFAVRIPLILEREVEQNWKNLLNEQTQREFFATSFLANWERSSDSLTIPFIDGYSHPTESVSVWECCYALPCTLALQDCLKNWPRDSTKFMIRLTCPREARRSSLRTLIKTEFS